MPILRIWPKVTSPDENVGNTARFCDKVGSEGSVCCTRLIPLYTLPLNLNPKRKAKRKTWREKCGYLCNNYYENESRKAESRTEKHWLMSPQTYLLGHEVAAVWLINSAFYPSRVIPGGSVITTLTQKRAVFPTFSSREVTFGQMRTIGIHFIIYPNSVFWTGYL